MGSAGKVEFNSNMDAWAVLGKDRGQKFSYGRKQLCHTWDRPKEEVVLSKRVSLAKRTLRTRAVERGFLQGAENGIDGDCGRGRVWFKKLRTDRIITIYRRTAMTFSEVYMGELTGWDEDVATLRNAMDQASLHEEKQAASLGAHSLPLSWKVARVLGTERFQETLKDLLNSCVIWERICAGQRCACKSSLRQTENR